MRLRRYLFAGLALGLGFLGWVPGTALSLHAATNSEVGVFVHILAPPNPVTDLSASQVGTNNGDVQLLWTAPKNVNGARITDYIVRFATYPAANPGTGEAWWNQFPSSQRSLAPAHSPGVLEFATISGLTLNVTYYFAIKSHDEDGQTSPVDARVGTINQAQSEALGSDTAPPDTPDNFAGVALSTTSIRWTWDAAATASSYLLKAYPGGTLIQTVTLSSATETGLTANEPITRTITGANAKGLSSPSASVTVYTHAATPANLAITNVGFTTVSLAWTAAGNPGGTQYRIERSLDGTNFVALTLSTSLTHQDTGLDELTSYYYRLRAINGDGIPSGTTVVVSTFTPKKVDFMAPEAPAGLKGVLDPTGQAFTLTWEDVKRNADMTVINDLVGYNVYRRTSLTATGVKMTPTPISVTAFADNVDKHVYYYTVRAIDASGNESEDSLIADSSPQTNVTYLGADGISSVVMPQAINDLLRSNYNKYGVPLTIVLSENPLPTDLGIVRSIRLNLKRTDNGEILNDLAFAAPQAVVAIGYNVDQGQVARGEPPLASSASRAPAQAAGLTPDQLSIFWHNGVTWVKVGGTLDVVNHAVKIKSSFLGSYQLRGTRAAASLSLSQGNVYPRLFTPNGDGLNDRVYFILENPRNATVTGEIVDLEGRHVRTLPSAAVNTGIGTTMTWDGKDDKGNVVPSGAYIYKIFGEGKSFTGSVGVAR